MDSFPILSLITFLPLVGVAFILLIRGDEFTVARNARWAALWTSLATFVISLLLWFNFDKSTADFQFVERFEWLPSLNISYHMGIDGISLFFVILSTFLTPICVLSSWKAISSRVKEYMIAFLVLETMMIGTFAALDFVMFYIFFEAVLIPMFIIIGVWGGPRRVYAAFKFFLYTLAGSVLLLAALLTLYFEVGTTDIPTLIAYAVPPEMQTWLWLAFFASFAVKMPMWPVHTWLPDAHVEAPTAGSVILAGVLLKMGGYGFLRFSLPMLPIASDLFVPLVYTLSVIAIIYTSLVALAQEDMKKLIAYSSVAHMGFVTIGIFTATQQGIDGALFQMLSHGVISAALFLCVGVVYDREHSREIAHYGGLVERMPRFAFVFHGLHARFDRIAGDEWVRRRIPYSCRSIPGQHLGGLFGINGRDPWCRLHALSVSACHFRQAGQGASQADYGSGAPGDRDFCTVDRAGDLDGYLARSIPECF